jgi:Fe-S-cluster containining protein
MRIRRFARTTIIWYSFEHIRDAEEIPSPLPAMTPTYPAQRCLHCGTCCRNGGPSLHQEDRILVEAGVIHTRHLYTIRKGEWARDPIRSELVRVGSDIIKIKGFGRSWACRFLDEDANRCRLYAHRPLECRELECWNPSRIEQVYARGRLSRRELLAGIPGLWELIEDHERRCSLDRIREWLSALDGGDAETARKRLAEIKAYDAELRKAMVARGRIEPDQLDFLLGRPVEQALRAHRRAEDRSSGRSVSTEERGI